MQRDEHGGAQLADVLAHTDVLARIEAALGRSEAAAEQLDRRYRRLRGAAGEAVSSLDQMIETERQRANG